MVGIYKITNTITNQCYIGQSIDIEDRWKEHIRNGKNLYHETKFYRALNKYGTDAFKFEVLEECPLKQKNLDERERYWIEYYDSCNNGYNSTLGGSGENSWTYDPRAIQDLWDKGYSVREIASMVGCGTTLLRKRLTRYGDYNTHTSISRGQQRAVAEGAQIGSPHVAVYQYDLKGQYITEYKSISEAARAFGHDYSGDIIAVLNHERQTAYGFQWAREKVESMPMIPVSHGKLVRCINTNQIFHSMGEAARWCGLKKK